MFSWGANSYGQLAQNDLQDRFSPVSASVPSAGVPIGITGGGGHSILWTKYCFYSCGWNSHGQLGTQDTIDRASWFVCQVPEGMQIIDVKCGWNHSLFILRDDENDENNDWLFGVGSNERNQLGLSEQRTFLKLTQILDEKVKRIACGVWHSLVLTEKGAVIGFGGSPSHKLDSPFQVPLNETEEAIDIAAGHHHCVVLTSSSILVFGGSKWGLSLEKNIWRRIEISNIRQLHSGWHHILFLKQEGEKYVLYGFGRNDFGQLGIGTFSKFETIPQRIMDFDKVPKVF